MRNKIAPRQYAIFLYEITREKLGIAKMIKGFLGILAKNNDLGKINEIIKEFEKYEKKQKGIRDVEIISAKPIAKEAKTQILKAIRSEGGADIKESVDPNLLGGARVIAGDVMIDGSVRRKLEELREMFNVQHQTSLFDVER